jgi:ABC-type Fe3+-hydroxamate transport system substrate-binding protein
LGVWRPERPGPRVLVHFGRPPGPGLKGLVVAGGRTFVGQLVRLVGGRNVFEDAREHYFSPSLEEVLARAPDLVLVLDAASPGAESEPRRLLDAWGRLFGKNAPKVRLLADQVFVVPGPRVGLAARRLARVLAEGGGR